MHPTDADGDSLLSRPPALTPSGPICTYGPRLAYTFFPSPAPRPEQLNAVEDSMVHFFTVDDQLLYLSFFQDSGPLNAACLYRFCLHIHTLLEDPAYKQKRIILYSSDEADKKANAALLLALYAMIVMRWTPSDVLHPIACLELQPFRDAGYARADYHLSIQACIYGIHRAISLRLLDLSSFDLVSYELYEKVEQGDWNWITPGFVAFASPVEPAYVATLAGTGVRRIEGAKPRLSKAFRNVLEEFEKGGVKVVVRLNKKLYDAAHFTERGMEHVEMYFDDGTNPTLEMSREFIDLADRTISAGGVVAVHCKAGLGRTGTLIGAYLIYKHGFSACEAIAFMRLMRPGSCVGPQQHFLYENQMTWVRWAAVDAHKAEVEAARQSTTPLLSARPITPPNEVDLAQTRSRQTTPVPSTSQQPPRTPGRVVAVPGQPRKTPGKSKHSVATPEVNDVRDQEEPLEEGMEVTDDMMLVQEDDEEPQASTSLRSPSAAITNSNANPIASTSRVPATSTRPTRIARARQRPLSAIADNRMVDRLDLVNGAPRVQDFRRSKPVQDLTTLFEASAAEDTAAAAAAAGPARYDLRGGRTTPLPASPQASPSRLPQRVPAKRRGGTQDREGSITSGGGALGSCQMESVVGMVMGGPAGMNGPARSVRRRRSSLGSTDFVQSAV